MAGGLVYQVGEARSRVTRCESNGCIEMTDMGGRVFDYLGEHQVRISETDYPGPHFFTDTRAIEAFRDRGPANFVKEPTLDDQIFQLESPTDENQVLLFDRRNPYNSVLTTQENIDNWRADITRGMADLATASAVNV